MKMKTQQSKIFGCSESRSRGKFIVIQAYFKRQEDLKQSNLIHKKKKMEKEDQTPKSLKERK